jgi:hypothetical protein
MPSRMTPKSWVKPILASVSDQLEKALTFIFSVAIAYDTAVLIQLHANNPYHITNLYNAATGWGPETNYARVIYIIVASVGSYFLLRWINRRSRIAFRFIIAGFVALTFLIGFMVPAAFSSVGGVDMFAVGEPLAPTNAYLHGQSLFTNIFFLHGAGIDVLLPRLSFAVLGHRSIGAYMVFLDMVQTVSVFLFAAVLARLLKPTWLFLLVTAWFLGSNYTGFDYAKDVPVYLVILLYWYWMNRPFVLKYRLAILGAIGFISSATLLYSIDVGVIMTLIAGLLGIGLLFIERGKDGSIGFRRLPRQLSHWYESFALGAGVLIGQLGILLFLGLTNYGNYIRMTFFQIPKYQGLEWDYPVPGLNATTWAFWLPILLAAIAAYMLLVVVINQLRRNRRLTRETAYAVILAALGVLYLRFGVGRPDTPHIDVSVPVLFVASFYIMQLYVSRYTIDKHWNVWPVALFVAALLWTVPPTWSPQTLFAAGNTSILQLRAFKHLPAQPNSYWLNKNELDVTNYITSHTKPNDAIFVTPLEPLYYFLANRPNPTRFAYTWFIEPQPYTNEALAALKKNPPKLVVFSDTSQYYTDADGVPINQRTPEITSWILKNYPVKTTVDQTVLLSR